jgi:hypothetical protein
MNERIRLLALQAGEYVNSVYTPPVRSNTPGKIWEDGHVNWHTQFNQKFAELIIRECVNQAHGVTDLRGVNDDMVYGADTAAVRIHRYFGVKE